ncbi:hypothetical protein ACFE04_017671 [Oxalis oulophora]
MEGKMIAVAIVLLGMLMCSVRGQTEHGLCMFSSVHQCYESCTVECAAVMRPSRDTCEPFCAVTCSACSGSTSAQPPSPDAENVIEQWTSPAGAPSYDDEWSF